MTIRAYPHILAALALCLCPAGQLAGQSDDAALARAQRVLRTTPLIDGHNDLPWAIRAYRAAPRDVDAYDLRTTTPGHTDFARLGRGMVGAQFWSVYIPHTYADSGFARVQLEQIDIARRVVAKYPDRLAMAGTAADVERIFREGKIASMLGIEGGHAIENSLAVLRLYYELGARYMTLTHNGTLDWADAASDSARHDGLSRFGEEVVGEMNRLGMLIDLSHVSPATMSDVLSVSQAPVIYSHSSARALTDHVRNVPDSILRRLPANGGVVMVTFVPSFVSEPVRLHGVERDAARRELVSTHGDDADAVRRGLQAWGANHRAPKATLGDVADHIEHIRHVAGIEHVGIGSDFDGISDEPAGLEDVSTFPALFAELARRGWSDDDLAQLAGGNLLRVMRRAEEVAQHLQRERPASTATIDELDGRPASD
jgi:membrane dipeptidase